MKLTKNALFASALLSSFSAAYAAPIQVSLSGIEAQIEEAVLNMEDVASTGGVVSTDVDSVDVPVCTWFDTVLPTYTNSGPIRKSLETYLDALRERVQNAWVSQRHAAFLRRQIIEAQLDQALQELVFRARNNDWTASHFQTVRTKLILRAEAAIDEPSSAYLRQRFEELSAMATQRAQNAHQSPFRAAMEEYRLEMIEFRLDAALTKLRELRKAGELTRGQFRAMVSLLHTQARQAADI